MTEYRFYHMERSTLEQVLPKLLEATLKRDWRAVVVARSEERVEHLNGVLWTWDKDSFLPHGSRKEGHAARQPVWLTTEIENPNGARVVFLVDGAEVPAGDAFPLCCELFDGRDGEALALAREHWKRARAEGHEVAYYQQGERGWEKKA